MDVRCTKCGIEYEFDDAKVTTAGVTVKCTSCGHVFKVKREEPSAVPAGPSTSFGHFPEPQATSSFPASFPSAPGARGDGAEWMVKRSDGQVFRFKELTTLQKWIVERKVGRNDEISKTGRTWKKLGEIAELASFFQVVDAANAALASVSQPPVSQPPLSQPAVSQPPVSQPPVSQPPPAPAPAPAPPPAADPAPPAVTAPMVPVRQPGRATGDVDLNTLDDDDPVLQMIKRRRRNAALAVVGVLVVAGAVASAAFWPQLSTALGLAAPATAHPAVDDAERALRADELEGLAKARAALAAKGVPLQPREAAAQVRLDVAIAGHARVEARAHDALGEAGKSAAKAARDEAAALLAKAYATLTKVRAEAPQLVETHLASAAYQLEKGALPEMRADLEAAAAAAGREGASVSKAAVDAEIAVLSALADAEAGLASDPAAALAKLPASEDGRLRAARAVLAVAAIQTEADAAAAKEAVEALPEGDERRAVLLKVVEAKTPKAPAVVDAGVAAAADAGVAVDAGSATASADAGAAGLAPDDDVPANASYEVVMQRAERARVNEKSRVAYALFVKAAKLRPNAPRPWLGIGWAALDLGKNGEAVRAFKKALDLDDDLSDAQFGLAEALRFSGRTEEAKSAYELYLKMDPNGRDAAVARRALESLN